MRLTSFNALALVAGVVAASSDQVALARVRGAGTDVPTARPESKLDSIGRRWCLFWIFGDTCGPATAAPSNLSSSSSVRPSTTSSPAAASSTSVVASPTPTSSAASGTDSATASPTAPPSQAASSAAAVTSSVFEQTAVSWSYPQPPLPARTASAASSAFTPALAGTDPFTAQTRYYDLTLEYVSGAPSGFQRRMAVINGQYPGPLIEGYQGDTLVITVHNNLDHPQAIHWHGMRQNYTNWADGVPGISQCSIPPGSSFTYRIKLDTEMGTYWFHSHFSNTLADGLTGGLVIHSRDQPYKKYRDYNDERMMYITDWQNDQSETIAHGLLNLAVGYRGSALPPDPDAILINGKGQSNCAEAQAGVKCFTQEPSVTKVRYLDKVRFRIINTGAHATLRFSIDNHVLQLIEVDDTAVQPINMHEVTLAPGQRASVIVKMDRGLVGDAFWIRATTAGACLNPNNIITTRAILWYTDFLGLTWLSNGIPKTQKWNDLHDPATAPCKDTDQEYNVVPAIREDSPPTAVQAGAMNSAFGRFIHPDGTAFIGFGYNDVSFINYINNPLLSQVEKGLELNPAHVASLTFNSPSSRHAIDFIINNHDPEFLAHPFHLHGRPFHIIARGKGALNPQDIPSVQVKTSNPIRRDTLVVGGNEWALLRIITDNPGVWPIHCHIGWHLAVGKLGVFIIRPDEVKKFTQPQEWSNLCAGTDPNEIGPARKRKRSLPPQSRRAYDLESEEYPGGVQDFTPPPAGATKHEYQSNGTHWWVLNTQYAGEIPAEHRVPEKRHFLESRTVFMNETDWWIPGTVFHGKLDTAIDVNKPQQGLTGGAGGAGGGGNSTAGAGKPGANSNPNENSNVVIVTPGLIVPGPGDALVEPAEIIAGTVVEPPATTFENAIPIGFTPVGGTTPEKTGAPSPNGGTVAGGDGGGGGDKGGKHR